MGLDAWLGKGILCLRESVVNDLFVKQAYGFANKNENAQYHALVSHTTLICYY